VAAIPDSTASGNARDSGTTWTGAVFDKSLFDVYNPGVNDATFTLDSSTSRPGSNASRSLGTWKRSLPTPPSAAPSPHDTSNRRSDGTK